MNIPVVYEDDWLLIADKPPGLLSVPDGCAEKRSLTGILNDDLKERQVAYRLHPCHRLDRETSGLIIYAKGKAQQQKIMLIIMPLMFGVIFYRMPAGLVLYWFINSTLMLLTQIKASKAK